ncbi:hypothetical protein, partial [Escherichia coli]|uniref:hypothetical protein n=1 Tax=Escherichia coli TaxID=562 RepID=UPI0016568A73
NKVLILCIAFKRMPVFPWYKLEEGINLLPGFAPELQGVYIEEHDGRKQVWCYVIKPRDAQSTLLKGEKL